MDIIPNLSNYSQEISNFFGVSSAAYSHDEHSDDVADGSKNQTLESPLPASRINDSIPEEETARLTIEWDDHTRTFSHSDLLNPNIFSELLSVFQNTAGTIIFIVPDLFDWPDESRFLFLSMLKELGARPRLQINSDSEWYESPFEAIVANLVGSNDIRRCRNGHRAAIEAATLFVPSDAWPFAVAKISSIFKDLGVKGILPQTIQKQIQTFANDQRPANRADPTELAREYERQHRLGVFHNQNPVQQGFETTETEAIKTYEKGTDVVSEEDPVLENAPFLRYFREDYYAWQGKSWNKLNSKEFESGVTQFLQSQGGLTITRHLISDVVANLQGLTRLAGWDRSLPFWIESENPLVIGSPRLINLANGMLYLDEFLGTQKPSLYPHDPRFFSTIVLPYAYDPEARCDLWIQTLSEIFSVTDNPANDRRIEVIQEFMGWSLFANDMQFESFMILIGRGANGKSTLEKVWEALLGKENVSHVPLEGLDKEFRLHEMAGKLANISGDMPRMEKVEEGILKQLTSGDSLQVNRKHKDPITMIPTAKLIFATNELPPINDRSEGIWRRMIAVPFLKQFSPEQRDTHRAENLMIELPGIFNWAMAGAKRLYQQERFTVCPMCAACVDEHRIHSDAFQQFVQEEVVLQKDASILTNSLYESYKKFCEKNGRKARNSSDFGRQVRSLPGVTKERQSYGQRPYEYRGMTCGSLTPRFGSPERINDSTNSSNP